jgi:hypothetical protein
MSIGAVGTSLAISPGTQQRPERQDMEALQKALSSGDLAGAQQAFAQFKQDFHAAHHGRALWQTAVPETLKQDLQGLQSALKSGDLSGAQQAFAQFKSDFQTVQAARREPPVSGGGPTPEATGSLNVLA